MKTRRHAVAFLRGITLVVAVSLAPAATLWADPPTTAAPPPPSMAAVQSAYGHLPLSFEANEGQTDHSVLFLSRGQGYQLNLTSTEAILALQKPTGRPKVTARTSDTEVSSQTTLRMQLVGANSHPHVQGEDVLPGKVNYFIAKDPTQWRSNVPTYAKVRYREVYSGIDVVYYGNQQQLEFDFVVAPGANPTAIQFAIDGADQIALEAEDLVAQAGGEKIRLHQPVVWQEINGGKQIVAGSYVAEALSEGTGSQGKYQIGFRVASYDTSKPLVIDPVLSYSTYLGGSNLDETDGIAVDASGNVYVVGSTDSPNFPTAPGVVQATFGGTDVFVAKLNPTGTALVYTTFLGGSGLDIEADIAVDASGNVYVTGTTFSTNFPTTPGVFQPTYGGTGSDPGSGQGGDAFVAKLSPTGAALVYATYLGGSGDDTTTGGLAIDAAGNAYVTGGTNSIDFPATPGVVGPTISGITDAFVAKLTPTGTALAFATYLGGSDVEGGGDIAVDASGNVYVTGTTSSTNFPTTPGVFQPTFGGVEDAFVAKLTPTGAALVYATYLGGNNRDWGNGLAVDENGNAYVAGQTNSTNFPTTPGVMQPTYGGGGMSMWPS